MQATKAVDEIISMGAVTQTELKEQLERQEKMLKELRQQEADQQSSIQIYEKKLMHAEMRVNEIQAQDKLSVMQHETDQRKLKFEIEKLKEQIKDLKNNEE